MTGFPLTVRRLVLARANGMCERCGQAAHNFELHHRRPRGMGGSKAVDTNTASNALALCNWCHRWIEANRDNALKGGWLVPQRLNPAHVVVLRAGRWVHLNDDGTINTKGF